MNTLESALNRINEKLFAGEIDKAFIWARLEVNSLKMDQGLNKNERQLRLAVAIEARYPQVGTAGQVLLAALAMAAV